MKLDMIMWAIKPSVSEITVSKDMVTEYTAFEDTELVTYFIDVGKCRKVMRTGWNVIMN